MKNRTNTREKGMALMVSLILVVILISFTGAMLCFSVAEAKGIRESNVQKIAFYAAEAGLEAGKYEIGGLVDPDGDGIGNKTFTTTTGGLANTYTVTAEDLGLSFWKLTSTGTVGSISVKLEAIVERVKTSAFPVAAFSSLGNLNDSLVKLLNNKQAFFDGGYSPAISVSDDTLFDKLVNGYTKKTTTVRTSFSGASYLTTILDGDTLREVQVPFSHETDPKRLTDLSMLYVELLGIVNNTLLPAATKALPGQLTFGSSTTPGVFYQPQDITLLKGQTLTGYGTLIAHSFILPYGTTVTWNGNLIVTGNQLKAANIDLMGGTLNVNGNLIVIGEGMADANFSVKVASRLNVNGSLLLATSYQPNTGKNVRMDLEGGKITIDGIMTLLGGKVDAKFKSGGLIEVTGMVQAGAAQGPGAEKQIIFFDGPAKIVKDDAAIRRGIQSWLQTGTTINLLNNEELATDEVLTHAWYQLY